eukprot:GHVS01041981.1.p1 GENE.GHVS01041981.1~~GHVS01041981.1.p1  ORF type:complete len:666 (+),score=144.74 GHVS01041981.1:167-2164(+)
MAWCSNSNSLRHSFGTIQYVCLLVITILLSVSLPAVTLPSSGRPAVARNGIAGVRVDGPNRERQNSVALSGGRSSSPVSTPQEAVVNNLPSVQEIARSDPQLSILSSLLEDVGATFYLEQTRHLTMFMPTNQAFRDLAGQIKKDTEDAAGRRISRAALKDYLSQLPWELKWKLIQHHIVPNEILDFSQMDLPVNNQANRFAAVDVFGEDNQLEQQDTQTNNNNNMVSFSSWEGSQLHFSKIAEAAKTTQQEQPLSPDTPPTTYFVDTSTVVGSPIQSSNGLVYKVDKVLVPASLDVTAAALALTASHTRRAPDVNNNSRSPNSRIGGRRAVVPDVVGAVGDNPTGEAQKPTPQNEGLPVEVSPPSSDAPAFVMETNLVHSHWDQRPWERRQSLGLSSVVAPQPTPQHLPQQQTDGLLTDNQQQQSAVPTVVTQTDDKISQKVEQILKQQQHPELTDSAAHVTPATTALLNEGDLLPPTARADNSAGRPRARRGSSSAIVDSPSFIQSLGFLPPAPGNPSNFGWAPTNVGWNFPVVAGPSFPLRAFAVDDNATPVVVADRQQVMPPATQADVVATITPSAPSPSASLLWPTTTDVEGEVEQVAAAPVVVVESPFPYADIQQEAPIHTLGLAPGLLPSHLFGVIPAESRKRPNPMSFLGGSLIGSLD